MGDSMSTIINATTTNGVVIQPDNSGSLILQTNSGTTALTIDTSQNATFAGTVAMSSSFLRNRIINGDMRIDQRNAGASVTGNDGIFGADRFKISTGYTSKATIQQSTTAPTGFNNSILLTSSAATSTASSDYMTLIQIIEGLNVADLSWGTANAKTITLSFWVRSSLTGTFGGSINNSGNGRSYVFTYTISAANTWEQKTVTIAGDTSGTWLTTNGIGLFVRFSIAMGSTYTNTAGSWYTGDYEGATGQVNILNTSGATWYVTGVQLEVGSTATPFERRLYNQELANCQRYFQTISNGCMGSGSTTQFTFGALFPVVMRTAPSSAVTAAIRISDITTAAFTQSTGIIENNIVSSEGGTFHLANFSGMTANRPAVLARASSGIILLSAEL
jgi:hypothetical protein